MMKEDEAGWCARKKWLGWLQSPSGEKDGAIVKYAMKDFISKPQRVMSLYHLKSKSAFCLILHLQSALCRLIIAMAEVKINADETENGRFRECNKLELPLASAAASGE